MEHRGKEQKKKEICGATRVSSRGPPIHHAPPPPLHAIREQKETLGEEDVSPIVENKEVAIRWELIE